jgi:carboxyl-terminal processing protease
MKQKIGLSIALAIAGLSVFLVAANDLYYFKINRSFEIFGAVYREIAQNYVLEIDPDDLMDDALEGMLNNLDPYTEYLRDEDYDDIDVMTTGYYSGLGISVGYLDSMITIVDVYDGYPADSAGLKIGDRIFAADSVVLLNQRSDSLRKFTRGEEGEILKLTILRDGIDDTLHFEIPRGKIDISTVSYSGMLNDSIGLIVLDRFSKKSTREVRQAYNRLKRYPEFSGLILDLRENGGGLMESAISIAEIFLPKGSEIVTTRGRGFKSERTFKSDNYRVDTTTKLAVIINGRSASASELLAGALQDHDRAVIVGRQSFGKGLVQSVMDLPYRNSIKITTSKYYIPSGRSIQKLDYGKHGQKMLNGKKDSVFYTKNGRIVYEMNGIKPDSVVDPRNMGDFVRTLVHKNQFFNFANIYANTHDSIPENFEIDEKIFNEFKKYVEGNNIEFTSDLEFALTSLEKANEKSENKKITKKIKEIEKILNKDQDLFAENEEMIKELLAYDIHRRFLSNKKFAEYKLDGDFDIEAALRSIEKNRYEFLLTPKSNNNSDN